MRLPHEPRWLARVAARMLGYFWLPCPRCGRRFAGYEVTGSVYDDDSRTRGKGTCDRCPGQYIRRPDGAIVLDPGPAGVVIQYGPFR